MSFPWDIRKIGLRKQALLLSILIFTILEMWRPCFFLTDDSLTNGMPIMSEIGDNMWAGKNIFYSEYIFGGRYFLPGDVVFLFWSPMYLFVCFIGHIFGYYYYADILAFINFQVALLGFVTLAEFLRKEYAIRLSNPMLLFFALSFTYNLYILNVGSSWGNFNVNHSVLPWIVLALWQKNVRSGWGICSLCLLQEFLAGHTVMSISNGLILSVLALAYAIQKRSWTPILIWGFGNITAVMMALPVLIPALEGFSQSHRAKGFTIEQMSLLNLPLETLVIGFFWGAWTSFHLINEGVLNVMPNAAFPASAAAWCIIPAVLTGRYLSKLDQLSVIMIIVVGTMIVRPDWISEIFVSLPLLKSMRWPFRELLQFQFFVHLFLVSRGEGDVGKFKTEALIFGLIVFIAPLCIGPIPTLNQSTADRHLVFSGEGNRYWAYIKTRLKPGEMIVPIVSPNFNLELQSDKEVPESLLGCCNFPAYFHVLSASGYSPSAPLNQTALGLQPYWPYGAYSLGQLTEIRKVAKERNLALRFVVLENPYPLKIVLAPMDGTSEDLTDHLPPEISNEK